MTTRVTSCSRVTRKSSDNTIWRQVYTIQQMAHAVSCFDSDPQSQPDPLMKGGGPQIHQMSHYPLQHKKCLKTSDHLMYNLNTLHGGSYTRGAPPPPLRFSHQPGTRPHTRKPSKKKLVCTTHLLHQNYNYGIIRTTILPMECCNTIRPNRVSEIFISSVHIYSHEVAMFSLSTVWETILTRHTRITR